MRSSTLWPWISLAPQRTRPMGTGLDLLALCKDGSELPVDLSLNPVQRGLQHCNTSARIGSSVISREMRYRVLPTVGSPKRHRRFVEQ